MCEHGGLNAILSIVRRQEVPKESRPRGKTKTQAERPEALKTTSPYKRLDRVLRPFYKLVVHHPDDSRKQVITTLSIRVPKFEKKRLEVLPVGNDITIRRFYRNVIKKPDFQMEAKIHIGTVEGRRETCDYLELHGSRSPISTDTSRISTLPSVELLRARERSASAVRMRVELCAVAVRGSTDRQIAYFRRSSAEYLNINN